MSAIQTFSFSLSSRKLIVFNARLAISRAFSISDSWSWNDMYWIHRYEEFGDPSSTRSKSLVDSGVLVCMSAVRSSSTCFFFFRVFLWNIARPLEAALYIERGRWPRATRDGHHIDLFLIETLNVEANVHFHGLDFGFFVFAIFWSCVTIRIISSILFSAC